MAQAGEVVDILRRGITDIEYAQARLGQEPLAQYSPRAGVARPFGASEKCIGGRGTAMLFLFEPVA